jgi:hypothetical protein
MPKSLEKEMMDIVKTLKKAKKYSLANCVEKNWQKTALAYSKELNSWRPKQPMEKEMMEAFGKELERLEIKDEDKTEILRSLNKRRVLQTAPHLGAIENPRMLCINWLGSLGVEEKPASTQGGDFYVVGMFSGIPFSNRSRPGRINRKKDSINLFPSTMQDALVYRSTVPEKLIKAGDSLPDEMYRFLPRAKKGESYTKWALETCQHVERKILGKRNLIYLDINEVITEYLIRVLEKPTHIFHKIFFDAKTRQEFRKAFPNEIMFYSPVMNGKYEEMENIYFAGNNLKSKHKEIGLKNPAELIGELKNGRLCPALITGFLALAFLNQFKCFGSFAQVEYLPIYQQKLARLSFMRKLGIEKIPTANLTTGVFPENHNVYPADMILVNTIKKFKPKSSILFGELLLPMKETLLESYFTGDERKK